MTLRSAKGLSKYYFLAISYASGDIRLVAGKYDFQTMAVMVKGKIGHL
jgi:hypothetical protein